MTDNKKTKKVATADLPIYTWSPDQSGQRHIAKIGNLPVTFSGATSEEARANAEYFRTAEMDRHARKGANVAALKERTAKAKDLRKAKDGTAP
jgi:hypothetical protein